MQTIRPAQVVIQSTGNNKAIARKAPIQTNRSLFYCCNVTVKKSAIEIFSALQISSIVSTESCVPRYRGFARVLYGIPLSLKIEKYLCFWLVKARPIVRSYSNHIHSYQKSKSCFTSMIVSYHKCCPINRTYRTRPTIRNSSSGEAGFGAYALL